MLWDVAAGLAAASRPSAAALIWNLAKLVKTYSMLVLVKEKSLMVSFWRKPAKLAKVSDRVTLLPSMLIPVIL